MAVNRNHGIVLAAGAVLGLSALALYRLFLLDGNGTQADHAPVPWFSDAPSTAVETDTSEFGETEHVPVRQVLQVPAPTSDAPPPVSRMQPVSQEPMLTPGRREAAFLAESVDEAWAPRVESLIYQHVADSQIDADTAIEKVVGLDVECRTSTCRLVLWHLDAPGTWDDMQPRLQQVRTMTNRMVEAGRPDVQSVHIELEMDQDQGAPVTTVYVMREGSQSSIGTRLVPRRMGGPN